MNSMESILVVQNESDSTTIALDHATLLAKPNTSKLILVDVKAHLDAYTTALADLMPKANLRSLILKHRESQLLGMLKGKFRQSGIAAETKVFDGVPFIEIIREAHDSNVGVVVKTADGDTTTGEASLGTTDMHLIRKSAVPVWVIDPHSPPPTKIVVAIDAVAESDELELFNHQILMFAKNLGETSASEIHVVSAWQLQGEQTMTASPFLTIDEERIEDLRNRAKDRTVRHQNELKSWFRRTYPAAPEPFYHCIKGRAEQVIPEVIRQENASLLVMGSVSRVDIPGLLIGNTAESILGNVCCSVATMKPIGFSSPVTST